MKHHVILGSAVALLAFGCGGNAQRQHAERNDALNETSGAQSSTFASPTSAATTTKLDCSTKPSPSTEKTSDDDGRTSTKPSSSSDGNAASTATIDASSAKQDASAGTEDTLGSDAGVAFEEQGPNGKACGARAGDTCTDTEYCAYTPGQLCGQADAQATCKPRPETCTANYNPVCGCNGETYGNSCAAAAAGVGVFDEGLCSGNDPEPVDCESIQCIRAITCAESCDGEVVQAGCCPCPDGLIDTFVECSDRAPGQ